RVLDLLRSAAIAVDDLAHGVGDVAARAESGDVEIAEAIADHQRRGGRHLDLVLDRVRGLAVVARPVPRFRIVRDDRNAGGAFGRGDADGAADLGARGADGGVNVDSVAGVRAD